MNLMQLTGIMDRFYLSLCLWIYIGHVLCARCPVHWLEGPGTGSCYRFWSSRLKSWADARATCLQRDGDLLRLDSKEETDWIIREVMKYPASYEWWIGLQRHPGNDSIWQWTNGVQRNETNPFIFWGSGEPNNYQDSEDCGEVWDNLLNDKNCDYPLQFICERPKDLQMKCDVDNGWDDITSGRCFKLFDPKVTFEEAMTICERSDAKLLTIANETEQSNITDFLDTLSKPTVWLAYQANTRTSTWAAEEVITYSSWWKAASTDIKSISENDTFCSVLDTNITGYNNWKPIKCNSHASTMCVKDAGLCPEGYIQHKTTCYLLNTQDFMTWNEASGYCNLRQISMLEIPKEDDLLYLANLLQTQYKFSSIKTVWIGLSGSSSAGISWESGAPVEESWKKIFTAQEKPAERKCGFFDTSEGNWTVTTCDQEGGAVCMVPVNTDVRIPSAKKPRYECPDGYILKGVICYRWYAGDPVDWYSAASACKLEGADLVSVHSEEENAFLSDLIQSEAWTGLQDRGEEGSYRWQENPAEPVYTNWYPAQPNNVEIGKMFSENCVAMHYRPGQEHHGKWNDYPCSFKRRFVCQIPAEWNIALGKIATQSSTATNSLNTADMAIDGCTENNQILLGCCSQTKSEMSPWLQVDLGTYYPIQKIVIHRWSHENCKEQCLNMLLGFRLFISNSSGSNGSDDLVFQQSSANRPDIPAVVTILLPEVKYGRFVRIDVPSRVVVLTLCEVQIFTGIQQNVFDPDETHCITDSTKWTGKLSHTVSGKTCQHWVRDYPHSHSYHDKKFPDGTEVDALNYCRDPLGEGQPWCYTLDPDVRWEFCPVPFCNYDQDNVVDNVEEPVTSMGSMKRDSDKHCGPNWIEDPDTGACYWLGDDYLTWSDAQTVCQSMGATLPHLSTQEEVKFLIAQFSLNQLDIKFWLGLQYDVGKQAWLYTDGSSVPSFTTNKGQQPAGLTACATSDTKSALEAALCLGRFVFSCEKKGPFIQYRTYSDQKEKEIPFLMIKTEVKDSVKTLFLGFEFKGYDGATILLKNSENTGLTIRIGGNLFPKSFILKEGSSSPKHSSLLSNMYNDTVFMPFWIKWTEGKSNGDTINVGRGSDADKNVFLTWTSLDEIKVSSVALATVVKLSTVYGGIWRFERERDIKSDRVDINLALRKPAKQSSTYIVSSGAEKAVDGCSNNVFSSGCVTHTQKDMSPWWEVDLGGVYPIREIVVHRRWDCCRDRLGYFRVLVSMLSDSTMPEDVVYQSKEQEPPEKTYVQVNGKLGRFVKIDIPGRQIYLELTEVQVFEDHDASRCGQGWRDLKNEGVCYKFSDVSMQWSVAKEFCENHDATMIVPESPQQQLYMYDMSLPLLEANTDRSLWLGLHDMDSEGNFQALNGKKLMYTDWAKGEPNNLNNEDCVSLRIDSSAQSGRWNDKQCDVSLLAACMKSEIPTTTTTTTTTVATTITTTITTIKSTTTVAPTITTKMTTKETTPAIILEQKGCKEKWLYSPVSQSCLRVFGEQKLTVYAAARKCMDENARLADIQNGSEQRVFAELIRLSGVSGAKWDGLWTSAIDAHEEGNWQWLMSNTPLQSVLWKPGQPDNYGDSEDCATVLIDKTYIAMLNDAPCETASKGYICKYIPDQNRCSDSWVDNEESGVCYLYSKDKMASWQDAENECKLLGGKLASFTRVTEQLFLKALTGLSKTPSWIGARFNKEELTWEWNDGTMWSNEIKAMIRVTPDDKVSGLNRFTGNNCGVQDFIDGLNVYNNYCSARLPYICTRKYNYVTEPPGKTTLLTTPGPVQSTTESFSVTKCGVEWDVGFVPGVCYKFVAEKVSWSEAQDKCVEGGGNLISILSDEEQSYVTGRLQGMSFFTGTVWIGANDRDMESGWRWTDGKPFAYFNWAPEQPDNFPDDGTSDEDCVGIELWKKENFGLWKDLPCSFKNGYVCKKDALTDGTTTSATTKPEPKDPEIIEFYQRQEGTRPDFRSHDLYEMGVRQTGSFRFSVKTKHDAHIMLHKDRGDFDSKNNYLVIIGGWGNTKSVVETVGGNDRVFSDETGLLTSNEYRWFWIYWNATNIQVGKTETIGNDVFLTLQGKITDINYVSVGTAQWTDAWWRIPKESNLYGCEGNGWLKYRDSCYLLVEEIKDWNEANSYCRKEGSELTSISDENEQNFIFSQLPKDSYCFNIYENNTKCNMWAERGECERNPVWMSTHCHLACKLCMHNCRDQYFPSKKCMEWADMGECGKNPKWMIPNCAMSCGICQGAPNRGFWIGMKRISTEKSYSWSDYEVVKYTNWDTHQPRGFSQVKGSCAAVFLQNGKWNDGDCEDPLPGFICKQPQILMPITTMSPFAVGCSAEDSYGYGSYCYVYVKSEKTWAEAKSNCAAMGGTLVYIDDSYTQAFVASELQNLLQDHWIGLSLTDGNFTWDGRRSDTLKMTHFEKPGFITTLNKEKQSGCFAMTTVKPVGLWKLYSDCAYKLPSICQISRDGYTTPPSTTTTTGLPETTESTYECEERWTFFNHGGRKSCFYVSDEKEPWEVAQRTCTSYGASMLTIKSFNMNLIFEKLISSDPTMYDEPVWLGLRDADNEGEFIWEDGSPATFYNWDYYEPNDAGDEDCVEVNPETGTWNDVNCYDFKYYICQIPYGKPVNKVAFENTLLKACDENGASNGWYKFQDFCYYAKRGYQTTWHEANKACTNKGSQLASIHKTDELEYIIRFMGKTATAHSWIGFNDLDLDNSYQWSDGSLVDFVNWAKGQPQGMFERCTVIYPNGEWHDYPCSAEKTYLCKKRKDKVIPLTTTVRVPPVKGACRPGFNWTFGNTCYHFSDDGDTLNWAQAGFKCNQIGGKLISIHTEAEQRFIAVNVFGMATGLWIGLHNLVENGQFDWFDNSALDYVAWAPNEPTTSISSYSEEPCVEVFGSGENYGKWNDVKCYARRGYICSSSKDPSLSEVDTQCTDGYSLLKNNCFKLLTTKQSWDQSKAQCNSEGGSLAQISEMEDVAVIQYMYELNNMKPLWIDTVITNKVQRLTNAPTPDIEPFEGPSCMSFMSYYWYKNSCSVKNAAVCIIRKDGKGQTEDISTSTIPQETSTRGVTERNSSSTFSPTKQSQFLPPFHQPPRSEPMQMNERLSGGQIAGIVIGTIGCLVIAAVVFYIVRSNFFKKPLFDFQQPSLGFDNALFHKSDDRVSIE